MTNSPSTPRTRRTTALIAATCCAAVALGGLGVAAVAASHSDTAVADRQAAATTFAQGVSGFAWNETDHDIKLEVRESGSRWWSQNLVAWGEAEFTGYDKGNAGVDVFGSAKHADGKKVYFEFDESTDYGNTARIGTESQMKKHTWAEKSINVGDRWTVEVEGHTYTIDRTRDGVKYTNMNITFVS